MFDSIDPSKPSQRRRFVQRALVALLLSAFSLITTGTAQAKPGSLLKTVTTPFTFSSEDLTPGRAVIDRQQRIVMVGSRFNDPTGQIMVVRYKTNDVLDFSFGGGDGVARLNLDNAAIPTAIAIDAHDRIVIAGIRGTGGGHDLDFFAARFLDNGQVDTSFNDGQGWMAIDFGSDDRVFAMMVDAEDNILLAGESFQPGPLGIFGNNDDFAIAKVRSDGHLDPTFGEAVPPPPFGGPTGLRTGKVLTGFGHNDWAQAITFDLLGRIIVVGGSFEEDDNFSDLVMARYSFDGQLDSSFGDHGKVTSSFNARYSWPHSVVVDDNGILVGGWASPGVDVRTNDETTSPLNNSNLALARFNHDDGSRDLTFGAGGVVQTDIAGLDDVGTALATNEAGNILLGGWTHPVPNLVTFALLRYDAAGHIDRNFGTNGVSTATFTDFNGSPAVRNQAHAIAINPFDHTIILVGESATTLDESAVPLLVYARFDGDGTFNPDYTLSTATSIAAPVAGSASTPVVLTSIDGFATPVNVTVSGTQTGGPLPAGLTASFSGVAGNTTTLQAPPDETVATTLTIAVAPTVSPQTFTLWLRPDPDPSLTHAVSFSVTVTARAADIFTLVDIFRTAGAIDNDTVANSLKAVLSNAQAAANAGDITTATQQLSGFLITVALQRGKHIATSATINGVPCNPVALLLADGRDAVTSLQRISPQHPIAGYVTQVDDGHAALGATVTLFDASNQPVASAQTDVTGLYRITATTGLTPGATYTAKVTAFPAVFTGTTPATQTVTWQSTGVALAPFVLQLPKPQP